jgi:hypothetical protein
VQLLAALPKTETGLHKRKYKIHAKTVSWTFLGKWPVGVDVRSVSHTITAAALIAVAGTAVVATVNI